MTGDCGAFYVGGRQVGGCHRWELSGVMNSSKKDGWKTHKVASSKAVVTKWWFFEKVESFKICLYWIRDEKMVSAGEYEIRKSKPVNPFHIGKIQDTELTLMF